jgi:predicted nucleic acid-binding protein
MEMMQSYLLDTNAIIYLIGGRLAAPLPAGQYSFSIITEIELLSFSGLSAVDEQKIGELLALLDRVELTQAVRLEAIRLRRHKRLKLPDAIIAASALNRSATLLNNDQALLATDGLKVQSLILTPLG